MLVSAAIDPYKKSYGNSLSSSATATGRTDSERITASPRNTCVPGVHACAIAGVMASTNTASAVTRRTVRAPCARGGRLDAKTLALAPNGTPQILELRLDRVVDRILRATEVVGDVVAIVGHGIPDF